MVSTRKSALVLALTALGLVAAPAAQADVYVVGSGGEFGTLNLATGAYTPIHDPTADQFSGDTITGLGFINGTLYGLGADGSGTDVFTINPTSGVGTLDGTVAGFTAFTATADDGTFYALTGADSAALDTINPSTLMAQSVNPDTGISPDGLLVGQNGTLYAADVSGSNDTLDSITIAGTVTPVGDTGVAPFSLPHGVSADGSVYGFSTDGSIYTINTTSGAATPEPFTYALPNGDEITAAAGSPAPEPSQGGMLALMGLGLGGLLLRARRQTKAD